MYSENFQDKKTMQRLLAKPCKYVQSTVAKFKRLLVCSALPTVYKNVVNWTLDDSEF